MFSFMFVSLWESRLGDAQILLLALYSVITPDSAEGPYGTLRIKTGLAIYSRQAPYLMSTSNFIIFY